MEGKRRGRGGGGRGEKVEVEEEVEVVEVVGEDEVTTYCHSIDITLMSSEGLSACTTPDVPELWEGMLSLSKCTSQRDSSPMVCCVCLCCVCVCVCVCVQLCGIFGSN